MLCYVLGLSINQLRESNLMTWRKYGRNIAIAATMELTSLLTAQLSYLPYLGSHNESNLRGCKRGLYIWSIQFTGYKPHI